jgi:hypothetical protein
MTKRKQFKLLHEGRYAAEVEIELIEDDISWSPFLTPADACKLDDVRDALRRGDIKAASGFARVFELRPMTPQ